VHLPEFSLFTCAFGSLGSLKSLLMEIEREIKEIVSDLACIYIFLLNL